MKLQDSPAATTITLNTTTHVYVCVNFYSWGFVLEGGEKSEKLVKVPQSEQN